MLAFFASYNLVNYENTFKHSIIIAVGSVLLLIFGIIMV